ncbi:MAG TPA: hypothetical protein VFR31_06455 [Thermoanaerobaculia bacterium]|nr:hypothetical protein [Thermoanaerobaculia bacterium]
MTKEPELSEEVVFTTPPTRLFRVRLTPKVRALPFLLLAVLLSVMVSAFSIATVASELSGLEREEILVIVSVCVCLSFGGSAVLYFLDLGRQRLGLLRLDPDAIRWHGTHVQPVKLLYADLGSARHAGGMLVLQGKEAVIELPAGAFEDPGAVAMILQDVSTRISQLPGGGPRPVELPLTSREADTPTWHPFEGGSSLGQRGSEEGAILRDEEHAEGSRITLEGEGPAAPFAITCSVYGWMVHTRFFGTEAEANTEYERMKTDLADILSAIPYSDDPEVEAKSDQVVRLIADFSARYP